MSDENLYEFVTRRERELIAQISATRGQINLLHGQLAQREIELVPRHSDYDWSILSQSRMGISCGATRISMLRATPD
jgi:hypothetical protein